MKYILMTLVLAACAGTAPAPEAPPVTADVKPAPKPQPILIGEAPKAPTTLAKIDPETLKVTYEKGADPKKVVDQLVNAWAQAVQQLQQCNAALQAKK